MVHVTTHITIHKGAPLWMVICGPNVTKCYQMLPDVTRCYQMSPVPNVTKCYQMLYYQMYQMLPNVTKCFSWTKSLAPLKHPIGGTTKCYQMFFLLICTSQE